MKLLDALKIIRSANSLDAPPFTVALCSGFTPLHFETFLSAHLSLTHTGKRVRITSGLFGDLAGNIERLNPREFSAVVVTLEWADLDSRLGVRAAGGWQPEVLSEIAFTSRLQLERVASAVQKLAPTPVVLSLPTLPLLPIAYTSPSRLSGFEAELRSHVAQFAREVTSSGAVIISPQKLDLVSQMATRFDIKSELQTGFPYTLEHADSLAQLAASATANRARKKGLITDLDDTLWQGILGDAGSAGVCWSLNEGAQVHGLYQQFLASLAASGTLIAVASKNDAPLVDETFTREDLLLQKDQIFPFEVHWQPKSQSVKRILKAWNVGADSVVFLDDSPMELAEVQAAFPEIQCHLFPKDDPAKVWELLFALREDFGAAQLTEEDALRSASVRSRVDFEAHVSRSADSEQFLQTSEAEIAFSTAKSPDPRAFELINKTNQFNLNGRRLTEAEWNAILGDDSRFLLKAFYKDRFGPLGMIAVLAGSAVNGTVSVTDWVMSCRAFSRRIEYQCLNQIFKRYQPENVALDFAPTERNGPIREFLKQFFGAVGESPLCLARSAFREKCPALYHSIKEL